MISLEEELYRENILEHYKNPQNKHTIDGALEGRGVNPSCGDVLVLYLNIEKGIVKDMSFGGEGCAISTAGASMLTEFAKGKSIKDLQKIKEDDVYEMLGVRISPAREKCALLSLNTLKKII